MPPSAQPNILFLMADQQQGATLDPANPCQTPHLDRLAQSGVRFTHALTPNAVCSPARASLLTGLYPSRHGMVDCTHSAPPYRADLRENLPMWPQRLRQSGYATGYFGKWHVERSGDLSQFGFDEFVDTHGGKQSGTPSEKGYVSYGQYLKHGPERDLWPRYAVQQPGYRDLLLYGVTDQPPETLQPHFLYSKGIDFIRRQAGAEKPWLCFVSTLDPHDPYIAPRHWFERYPIDSIPLPPSFDDPLQDKPAIQRRLRQVWQDLEPRHVREAIACYYASCSFIDEQVGRILRVLEETGQRENTIVIYTADHGDLLGAHGLFFKGAPAYEPVYNIPLIVAGPGIKAGGEGSGKQEGRTSPAHANLVDLAPTILDLAGAPPMEDVDGHSLVPLLEDRLSDVESSPWAEGYAEFHGQRYFYTQRIVWHGRYKYIFNAYDVDELYDLEDDPHEMVNLAADPSYRTVLEDMATRMWRRAAAIGDRHLLGSQYAMFRLAPVGPLVAADVDP